MNIQSVERRKSPRAYIQAQTLISPLTDKNSIISAWMYDISLGGAGVKAKKPSSFSRVLQEGDEIQFRTREDYFEFQGRGKVKWTSPQGDMMGIEFSQIGQRSREALEELLRLFPSFSMSIH